MQWTRHEETTGFDRWLRCNLHEEHDAVLSEAIPDELMALADCLGAQDGTNGS